MDEKTINVQGSYIDVHDNENVYLNVDKAEVRMGQNATKEKETETTGLLLKVKPMFYGDEREANNFLNRIQGMKPTQITALVNQLVKEKKLSDLSCHRDLWQVLHDEGLYTKSESKLIKLVADEYGIDEATFLELETSLQTMAAIDREQAWLDTVDRPYREIEPISDELADRKIVIMESVRDLLDL